MAGSSYRPLTDTWILGRPKVPYYGAYPCGFLHRARRVMGVHLEEPLLHVCGGRARDYSSPEFGVQKGVPLRGFGPNDRTLDLDPALEPDYLQDAREPFPPCPLAGQLPREYWPDLPPGWLGILVDRPYTEDDADSYAPGRAAFPDLGTVLRNALAAVVPGGRVGVLDYLWPRPPTGLECVAAITVVVGYGNRVRLFSVYERVDVPVRA